MQLTFRGEVLREHLESQMPRNRDPFETTNNWVLREIGYRQPVDEDRFYHDVLQDTSVKSGPLKAAVSRLFKKGLIEL
jgi:hypothetical protein